MIRYYLYQWQAKGDLQGLWFAKVASDEILDLQALSVHMHNHNCPYSEGTILGVLRDAVKCTKELLLEGKKVKFDNLALFSVGIKGTSTTRPLATTLPLAQAVQTTRPLAQAVLTSRQAVVVLHRATPTLSSQ